MSIIIIMRSAWIEAFLTSYYQYIFMWLCEMKKTRWQLHAGFKQIQHHSIAHDQDSSTFIRLIAEQEEFKKKDGNKDRQHIVDRSLST